MSVTTSQSMITEPFTYQSPSLSVLNPKGYSFFSGVYACTLGLARKGRPEPRQSTRGSKYNTLLRNKDVENQKRRDQFCRKIKQDGEERRWVMRTEQILRTDFLSRQRQWEEEQIRRAAEVTIEPDDLEGVGDETSGSQADLFQELLSQQELEMTTMSSMLEEAPTAIHKQDEEMGDYGSDEEVYSQLLMDAIQQLERANPDKPPISLHDTFEMDTTTG